MIDLGTVAAGQVVSADFSLPLATEMPAFDHDVESRACASAAEDLCDLMASCAEASVAVRAVVDAWVSLEVLPGGVAEPGQRDRVKRMTAEIHAW